MTLLVTGGAGYLGSELLRQQPDARTTSHDTLDVNDADAVMRYFLKHGPTVVIHTAYRMGDAETKAALLRDTQALLTYFRGGDTGDTVGATTL